MNYQETVTLKDGSTCLIRGLGAADGEKVLNNFNLTHAQTENLLTYPEENSFTVEQEQEFLESQLNSPNSIEMGAFVDGILTGTAGIGPVGEKMKVRHRAKFGISIDRAYWNRGIGRELTRACIACACEAGFLQLELDVVAENKAAIKVYEQAGFREFGRNPRGFRTQDGAWQELVHMRLEL